MSNFFLRAGVDSDLVVDSRPALRSDFHVFCSMGEVCTVDASVAS